MVALAGFLIAFTWISGACAQPTLPAPKGMVWIRGGEFRMGSDAPYAWPVEGPCHSVRVDGFFMDEHEVTNAQFRAFVRATAYVTVAERVPTLEEIMAQVPPGTPPPPKEVLVAGALVFKEPSEAVPLHRVDLWWEWTPGADWKHPEGPGSGIAGKENHPVIHVCWEDAVAYADWAGKRLPTEAEWEFAARGGLDRKRFVWGDDPLSEGKARTNIWQGEFPHKNTKEDGYVRTGPVKAFEPNGYGLYDMAGNVWEWCSDWYRADTYAGRGKDGPTVNPIGPDSSFDPVDPYTPKRVMRGGSFLCHDSYCSAYRPSARRGNSPDTGMSHVGFRCVMTEEMWKRKR